MAGICHRCGNPEGAGEHCSLCRVARQAAAAGARPPVEQIGEQLDLWSAMDDAD